MHLKFTDYSMEDLTARYVLDEESGHISLCLLPDGMETLHKVRREWLNAPELEGIGQDIRAWKVGSLAHLALSNHPRSRGAGQTLKHGFSTDQLRFVSQQVAETSEETRVLTVLRADEGYGIRHTLTHRRKFSGFMIQTEFFNDSNASVGLDLLTSFALDDLSPFAAGDCADRLALHRVRGGWAEEGLRQRDNAIALGLSPAWAYVFPESERYGVLGTWPVGRFFPYGAVEDAGSGVIWGAWLAHNGSWQMELSRADDGFSFSGGLADREFGTWRKTIAPGECFMAPAALLSVVRGQIGALDRRLMDLFAMCDEAGNDDGSSWVFNEWCTSWGHPSHEGMLRIASTLEGLPVRSVIIDAGWTEVLPGSFGQGGNGDWLPSAKKFPLGIGETARALRKMGYIPGIWFEFEVATPGSKLYNAPDEWFLRDDAHVILTGERKFLDLSNHEVREYLRERVISFLKNNEIGYLKVDYNDNPGQWCDGDSPGEGMRRQAEAVASFFREIRTALPGLCVENCASGGHRSEPMMMGLSEMTSISDAHESPEIPVIAARLTSLLPPGKSQIWVVVNPELPDSLLRYRLCSGFFGRVCLSGRLHELSAHQTGILRAAAMYYETCAEVILKGTSRTVQEHEGSLRHLRNAQVVFRSLGLRLMITAHLFDRRESSFEIELPPGQWHILSGFSGMEARLVSGKLIIENAGAQNAFSYLLESQTDLRLI